MNKGQFGHPALPDFVLRYDKAYRMRNQFPSLDWLSVAINCGYYDHQHFAKDCKELTYLTPTFFLNRSRKSPNNFSGCATYKKLSLFYQHPATPYR